MPTSVCTSARLTTGADRSGYCHALQGQVQPLIGVHVGKEGVVMMSSSSLPESSSTSTSICD